jgi:hypothetical protein
MGLGGNVWELEESSVDLANSSGSSSRAYRGGGWSNRSDYLLSSVRYSSIPSNFSNDIGFRVASVSPSDIVPEPSTLVIGTLFGLGGLLAKRRMKR